MTGPPRMYIQLLMPQSVQRLSEIMLALQQRPSHKVQPSLQVRLHVSWLAARISHTRQASSVLIPCPLHTLLARQYM
jgi:hypothetical protein